MKQLDKFIEKYPVFKSGPLGIDLALMVEEIAIENYRAGINAGSDIVFSTLMELVEEKQNA